MGTDSIKKPQKHMGKALYFVVKLAVKVISCESLTTMNHRYALGLNVFAVWPQATTGAGSESATRMKSSVNHFFDLGNERY